MWVGVVELASEQLVSAELRVAELAAVALAAGVPEQPGPGTDSLRAKGRTGGCHP